MDTQKDLYLLFQPEKTSWGSFNLHIRPCHYEDGYTHFIAGDEFENLECVSFLNDSGDLIYWRIRYESVSPDFYQVETMYKTLSRIKKEMDKFSKRWGNAETFGDFVVRFGNALGVKAYLKASPRHEGCIEGDAESIKYWIRDAVFSHLNPPTVTRS